MTKQQELEILSEAITKLGPDSYLGPWLCGVKYEVASLVRSDIFPDLSLRESVKTASDAAKTIIEQANADAAKIIGRAHQTEAEARKECNDIRNRLADAIRQAEKAINR